MTPASAFAYAEYRDIGHPKLPLQCGHTFAGLSASNLTDIMLGKFGVVVSRAVLTTLLVRHVLLILCRSSKKQVGGVATSSVIASMANEEGRIDRTMGQFISKTMWSPPSRIETDTAIAIFFDMADPLHAPIFIGRGDKFPERFRGMLPGHGSLLHRLLFNGGGGTKHRPHIIGEA